MACDALVLAGRAQALRHAYGRAIVKSAHGGAVSAACHLHTINELKGRLRMLSKTRKFSPTRIVAGTVGVTALSLAALGLTASGTQAAERIKDKVEAATGIDLSAQDAPAAPEAPEAPDAQEAPEAPEAPAAPAGKRVEKHVYRFSSSEGGKDGKKVIVMAHGDGDDAFDAEAFAAAMPEIRDAKCGDGKQPVVTRKDGKKVVMVICSDRIAVMAESSARMAEKHAELAVKMAEKHKEMGLKSALMGLRIARARSRARPAWAPRPRPMRSRGIDEAIREIEKESD